MDSSSTPFKERPQFSQMSILQRKDTLPQSIENLGPGQSNQSILTKSSRSYSEFSITDKQNYIRRIENICLNGLALPRHANGEDNLLNPAATHILLHNKNHSEEFLQSPHCKDQASPLPSAKTPGFVTSPYSFQFDSAIYNPVPDIKPQDSPKRQRLISNNTSVLANRKEETPIQTERENSNNISIRRSSIKKTSNHYPCNTRRSHTIEEFCTTPREIKETEEKELQQKERLQESLFYAKVEGEPDLKYFQKFLQGLRKTLQTGEVERIFIDEKFPPSLRSLIGGDLEKRGEWSDCIWLNPSQIFPEGEISIFKNQVDPDSLNQGRLSDCYFLASISSLAQWPDRIKNIFVNKERNKLDCYAVRVCEMGEWKEIVVDGFFPCYKSTKRPMFTIGNDNELWVLILEKVWAKIYGSYAAIEQGLTREALHDLTGAPTRFFLTDTVEEWDMIWSKLKKAIAKGYVVTCGTMGSFKASLCMKQSTGLIKSHSYSLLGAHEELTNEGIVRLVKLRNPWGETEWRGPWKDSCLKWTSQLKGRLNWRNENDGRFFMAYEDFMRHFEDIQFCYIHDDYKYNYLRVRSTAKHAVYFDLTITTAGKYYITVNQESKRRGAKNPVFKYSTVSIVISKILDSGEYEYVTGSWLADREVWAKAFLTPGRYIVYAKVQWIKRSTEDFVISSYGPAKTILKVTPKKLYENLLEQTFISHARRSDNLYRYSACRESGSFRVVDLPAGGFLYSYYKNMSDKIMECTSTVPEGFKLRKPYRGREYSISIPPRQEKIVLLRSLPDQEVKEHWDEKVEFKPVKATEEVDEVKTGEPVLTLDDLIKSQELESAMTISRVIRDARPEHLDEEARELGTMRRIKDKATNKYVSIFRYELRIESGMFLLIENETEDLVLGMNVRWHLEGLEPVGIDSSREFRFELGPKSLRRLVFQRTTDRDFDAKFEYEYDVLRAM